jgi:DNA-directed RNA polymerase alpha subunit
MNKKDKMIEMLSDIHNGISQILKKLEHDNVPETTIHDLRLPSRIENFCNREGITTLKQLLFLRPAEYRRMRNIGKKTYDEMILILSRHGIKPLNNEWTYGHKH